VTIGYLPLYRVVDGRPVMVIVYEEEREHVDRLRLHQVVTVGRESEQADSVWVRPSVTQTPVYTSTMAERMRAADIGDVLLRMWALPELTEWMRSRSRTSEAPAVTPEPLVKSDGKPFDQMHAAAARRFAPAPKVEAPAADDAVEDALNRAQLRAVQNGKHHTNGKPPPKG
jgi:hypothetical protein